MSLVSESSKVIRSLVKPALHDGEQIGGGVGCRASAGSGGRVAWGVAAGGLGGGEGAAQALTSSTGSSKVISKVRGFLAGMFNFLLHRLGAPEFFGSRSLDGHTGFALPVAALALQLGHRLLVVGALVGQAQGLQAQQSGKGQDGGKQDAGGHGRAQMLDSDTPRSRSRVPAVKAKATSSMTRNMHTDATESTRRPITANPCSAAHGLRPPSGRGSG